MQDFNRYTSQVDLSPVIDFTLQTGTEKHYRKGDWFVRQGDLSRTIGFVATGSFRYSCTDSAGEVKTVGYTFEKSFVGNYPALLQQVSSSIDIQALCDCTVYECTYHQLTYFFEQNAEHLRWKQRITEVLLWEVYERMVALYRQTPEERYKEILTQCPHLLQLVTLKELASYLQIRPETLSRIRRRISGK